MAGMLFSEDLTNLEPRIFIEEILGFARNNYNLRNLCQLQQCPKLQARVKTATRGTVAEKVEEGAEADIMSASYSYEDLSLWKNVGHVSVTDEARMRASFDVLGTEMKDAGVDLARAENTQIATEFDNGTSVAGSDWGGSNDPAVDVIEKALAAMINLDKGYDPKDLALNPLVYADLVHNAYVAKEITHTALVQTGGVSEVYGLNITRDIHLTSTSAYVLDKAAPACILAQGGTSAERYREPKAGYDAYLVRQWLEPKVVLTDAIYILTGVHA